MSGISQINGGYGNYYAGNYDDFMAQQILRNNVQQPPQEGVNKLTVDTVSFSGNSSAAEKTDKGGGIFKVLLLGGGAFILGKNWKVVKNYVSKLFNKGAIKNVQSKTKILNNSGKRIQHTSVTGASKPITNETEAKVMTGLNTKHANAKSRKLVEESLDGIVTPQAQAAYDKEIAYRPLNQKQKAAKARLDSKNKAQRAELNSIANNSKGAEKLEALATTLAKEEQIAQKLADGAHKVASSPNTYITQNGKVVKIITAHPNSKGETEIIDPMKIAKHLSKYDINPSSFLPAV